MYIISRAGRKDHPLVHKLIDEAKRHAQYDVLSGLTDGNEYLVYQTKWLKYGLDLLGFDSLWVKIPETIDSYSTLFWMKYRDAGGDQNDFNAPSSKYYLYLWWAKEHFYDKTVVMELFEPRYPMTWNFSPVKQIISLFRHYHNITPTIATAFRIHGTLLKCFYTYLTW